MRRLGLSRAIPLLALASCAPDASDFYIINRGGTDIGDVTVAARGATWRLGDLPRGGTAKFTQPLDGEGGPVISWTVAGKRVARQGCYYTGGIPLRGSMVILDARVVYHCR